MIAKITSSRNKYSIELNGNKYDANHIESIVALKKTNYRNCPTVFCIIFQKLKQKRVLKRLFFLFNIYYKIEFALQLCCKE